MGHERNLKISVAVPSMNYGRFIGACIRSILMQSHTNFEIFICDGGSVDESISIIQELALGDKRVTFLSKSDRGQADAIDKAFRVATGDIFCYLNADDLLLVPDAFSSIVSLFNRSPETDVACFRSLYVDAQGSPIKPVNLRINPFDNLSWIKFRGQVVQPSAFWRQRVYRQIPFNTEWHFCFDSLFFYEAYNRFQFAESALFISGYRLHGANKSSGVSWQRITELAAFESYKFGRRSFRGLYLRFIARCVRSSGDAGPAVHLIRKVIYYTVNSLSLLSWYRLPSI
jgi:glycosyltransferase involved in cell wall biosynthesis